MSSNTFTTHSYVEESYNDSLTTKNSRIYIIPRKTLVHVYQHCINTTLYAPETRPLSSRINAQLRDSPLSPPEATTCQAAVSNADKVPLLGYPEPLFTTRPAHNIQTPRQ